MATQPAPPATTPGAPPSRRVTRVPRKRLLLLIGGVVILVSIGMVGWLAATALSVKDSLEQAQGVASHIADRVAAEDVDGAIALVDDLRRHTGDAAQNTAQPIWRVFEPVPAVGPNLAAVRQLSAVVDALAADAVQPMVDVAAGGFDSFRPVEDRIDVERVEAVAGAVATADDAVAASLSAVEQIETDATIGQVTAAKGQLRDLLVEASQPLADLRTVTDVAPALLGADGPRNYILLFPNNAESMSLGGNTAAWLVVNATDGLITITAQPSSNDFARDRGSPIALPPELDQIYTPGLFGYVTNTQLRPDFPTAAALAQGFWQRNTGQVVDGVISFDPIALSYLLEATGPLTLPSGHVLAADTAVRLLLSDVYALYSDPSQQDEFFAQAAATVFTRVTTATTDVSLLAAALTRAVDDNRLMAWSAHPNEQALLAGTRLEGTLARDNADATQLGVFFVENSASKMSYYLQTAVAVASTACQTPDAPTFTATIDLRSAISAADYDALPDYVRAHGYTDPVKTRTLVYVYGPVGASYSTTVWNGGGLNSQATGAGTDLGRPVVAVAVDLRPGEASSITVTFAGAPGDYGPVDARVTPMVQPTVVTRDATDTSFCPDNR